MDGFKVKDDGCLSVNVQARVAMDYVPTEEERRVFRECSQESFWYRCKCLLNTALINDCIGKTNEAFHIFLHSGALLCGQHGYHSSPGCQR